MEKEFRSDYFLQFLSDSISLCIDSFRYDDEELLNRCRDLMQYIEDIRYPDNASPKGMNLKSECYVEIYED